MLTVSSMSAAHAAPTSDDTVLAFPDDFKAPFECGLETTYTTYSGHDENALDFIRADGGEDTGTPILASAAGTAHLAEGSGAGQVVNIDHEGGWQTRHYHLDTRTVQDGEEVEQGQQIGTMGATGVVTGPHLHYEQRLNDVAQEIELEGEALGYPFEYGQEFVTSTNGCDGEDPPPEAEATELAYTGPETAANGEALELSGTLTDESGDGVAEKDIGFVLGTGDSAQECEGTTDGDGDAGCTIDEVDQPLTDDATVPVALAFDGSGFYLPSEASSEVALGYVTGSAFGLSAEVPVLGLPISLGPEPETGEVRTAEAETMEPVCAERISSALITADVLCAEVETGTSPAGSTASTNVADASIGLVGLPVIGVSGVEVSSTSTCEEQTGSVDMTLTVAGVPVDVGDTPNLEVDLGGVVGTTLVVNEQIEEEDGSLTVNGVHLTGPGGIDVVVGSATSAAHNCP